MPSLRFYRIISDEQPTHGDFLSDEAAKKPPRNPDKIIYWRGFSVFETLPWARNVARKHPWHGTDIAEMTFPADSDITFVAWGEIPAITQSGPIPTIAYDP